MTQKDLIEIAKSYFEKSLKIAFEKVIYYYFPFMAVPPLSKVLDIILDKLISKLADALEDGAFFIYTDLRVNAEGKAFVAAKLAYKNAKTPEEKQKYEAEIIDTLYKLVSLK